VRFDDLYIFINLDFFLYGRPVLLVMCYPSGLVAVKSIRGIYYRSTMLLFGGSLVRKEMNICKKLLRNRYIAGCINSVGRELKKERFSF
jgi:hypothetical protein